ncbi:hypothetical protein [Corynebacterium sp.]|uniref:hypothetical protein n=1 Tax=Corynebacterium sp. TaxID=1720 RepID=UPI0026DADD9A|nr:hypothetical protein [Corynebacterium sp.]MDO5076884.1 hypothetical protein [Corynebacterium sp.]
MQPIRNLCNRVFTFAQINHPVLTARVISTSLKLAAKAKRRQGGQASTGAPRSVASVRPERTSGIRAANWAAGVPE